MALESLLTRVDENLLLSVAEFTAMGDVDGKEVFVVVNESAGHTWHLRCRPGNGDANGNVWEFVGGAALTGYQQQEGIKLTGATYQNVDGLGPSVAVPLPGEYLIRVGARHRQIVNQGQGFASVTGTGVTPSDSFAARVDPGHAPESQSSVMIQLGPYQLTASTYTEVFRVMGGTGSFYARWMSFIPIKVRRT